MAISGTIQSLSAAFSFGILLQAALGALLVYWKGHGSTIFQDGRRLVLVLFLLFAALWAQIDFLNLLISPTASTTCQIGLIFTTAFDQLARVVLEQFLLWSVGNGTKLTPARVILQIILGLRVVAGGLLAGFTRPQFTPFCVAYTSLLPASIIVLALDAIIIGVLLIQALSLGLFRDMRGGQPSDRQEQSKAVVVTIFGFAFWTGMSVPMILGWENILLILRTVLPANGLVVLVGIVIVFQGALVSPRIDEAITPEAQSPFMNPLPPTREILRDDVNVDGSPIVGRSYTKNGLFVVNPSSTPQDSPGFQSNGNNKGNYSDLRVREVELNDQGPTQMRNAPGYRGSSGIFPSIVSAPLGGSFGANQGGYAPQIRPSATAGLKVPAPTAQQKKSLFARTKPIPKTSIRNLGISKPLAVDAEGYSGPRMETVDLETAAASERERRQAASARIGLVANRPAPKPPTQSAQEALRRSVSVTRKDMPGSKRQPLSPVPSGDSSGLSREANATSTSASLSPGRDEVRRRSPRSQNHDLDEKALPKPTLQMKQVIGLPGNPRARLALAKEAAPQQQQTVMFMNDIVYDNPGVVKTIINGAPDMYAKRPKTADSASVFSQPGELKSSGSIIHRPRPVKRGSSRDGTERTSFYAGPPPPHRRSKSASSVANRKSVLYSSSGSPTKLPPLPRPPPTTASGLTRLLPNNTKSMTFDEKIELLFPAPPGVTLTSKRRSSVPSLPRVPSEFISDEIPAQSFVDDGKQSTRASKRSTISFGFQTPRLSNQVQSPVQEIKDSNEETYRFSANTYRTLADDAGEALISGIPSVEDSYLEIAARKSTRSNARRSSAIFRDVHRSVLSEVAPSENGSHGGETTIWGSVHSPTPAIDISKARARPTLISSESRTQSGGASKILAEVPQEDMGETEYVTIGLESEENRRSFLDMPDNNRRSFFLDAGHSVNEEDSQPQETLVGTWHRRIGDELPTFSERKTKTRSRKMPPPTPLLLNTKGRKATVVVRQAEPSPEESDAEEKAIKEIQAQLKRFEEEPSRGSVGSLLRRLPDGASEDVEESNNDSGGRFKLLENLEKEMGQQENQWQQMHNNFDRDSMSVVMTPGTVAPTETDLSRNPSTSSSRPPSRGVSRRARIRSSMTVRSKGEESASTSSSDNSRASVWQQRLAEAQMEYMENAPALLRKKSLNFLSVNKPQITSPTPPDSLDTDTETDAEVYNQRQQAHNSLTKEIHSLWQEPFPSPMAAAGRMWNIPFERPTSQDASEPPAKTVRPRQRRNELSLSLLSNSMWEKPSSDPHSRPVVGLWGSKTVRPVSIKVRPVTQRPQRKSKRVTFLPDIIESPQPLPNQRDTLGIFQFPWGEKSDNAVYQPAFNPALLAGPVINAKLDARSRELEPDFPNFEEYSSSFFDDYEEEDEDDDFDEDEEEMESDDDFDETTLWEIASLLKSEDVPSKKSLLPPPRQSIEEYDDDQTDFESDSDNDTVAIQNSMVRFPIEPLARLSVESAPLKMLWESSSETSAPVNSTGLPQPELTIWQSYIPSSDNMLRSKPQYTVGIPSLTSKDMWSTSAFATSVLSPSAMWGSKPRSPVAIPCLWTSVNQREVELVEGLFSVTSGRISYRHSNLEPAAINMLSKPRLNRAPAPQLTTRRLWNIRNTAVYEHDWISESSVRPVSPSLDSLPSSGRSSPSSETASLRTTSTKASSIWSSVGSIGAAAVSKMPFWDSKSRIPKDQAPAVPRNVSPTADKDVAKFPSKLPVRQVEPKVPNRPQPKSNTVRDSKGFATRDMWEARAPVSEGTPVRKSWKKQSTTVVQAPVQPSHRATRHQYRAPAAFRGNWEDALTEAIRAGMPKQVFVRHIATPSDWDNALAKAISLSKPRMQRPAASAIMWEAALAEAVAKSTISSTAQTQKYDSSVLHPVFFTESRASRSSTVHPAAMGHFSEKYDPSVLHPVFFTKSRASRSSTVHPAAMGHFSIRLQRPHASPEMWKSALAKAVSQSRLRLQKPISSPADWKSALEEAIGKGAVTTSNSEMPAWMKDEIFREQQALKFQQIKVAETASKRVSMKLALTEEHSLWKLSPIPSTTLPGTPSGMPLWMKDEVFKQASQKSDMPDWMKDEMFKEQHVSRFHRIQTTTPLIEKRLSVKMAADEEPHLWRKSPIPSTMIPGTPSGMPLWMKDEIFKEQHMLKSKKQIEPPVWVEDEIFREQHAAQFQQIKRVVHEIKRASLKLAMAEKPDLWRPSPIPSTALPGTPSGIPLWMKDEQFKEERFSMMTADSPVRKNTTAKDIDLPILQSTSFWQPKKTAVSSPNWLESKSKSSAQTWVAPAPVAPTNTAWAIATQSSSSSDMFAHLANQFSKRPSTSRSATLPSLSSSKLFQSTNNLDREINWIMASSAKKSLTWSAAATTTPKVAPGALAQVSMFTDAIIEPVKRATSSRQATIPRLESNVLFTPAFMSKSEVNWIAISSTKNVSPSAQISKPLGRSLTWVAPAKAASRVIPGTVASSDMFATVDLTHVRTPTVQRPSTLPTLSSTKLFMPVSATDKETNWIKASSMSAPKPLLRSLTWVAPSAVSVRLAPGVLAYEELFAGLESKQVKKASSSRQATLPRLTSTDLFKPASTPAKSVNWLKVSSASPARERSQTWVAPSNLSPKATPGAIATRDMFVNMKSEQVKKAISRPAALPRLESTEMFTRSAPSTGEIDWLKASSAKPIARARAQTWVASSSSSPTTAPGTLATKEMFANIKGEPLKRISSRPSTLPRLQSTELFTSPSAPTRETNWLKESSSKPMTLKRSQTWVAPSIEVTKSAPGAIATNEMFSNIAVEHVKKAVSSRPAALPRLHSTELFKASPTLVAQTHWLQASSAAPRRGTWKARIVVEEPQRTNSMWEPQATLSIPSPSLFENHNNGEWRRSTREPSEMGEIESTEMWSQGIEDIEAMESWLEKMM